MENKKVKNATKTTESGIDFKSKMETIVYRTLLEEGITPSYEGKTFVLSPRVRPSVPFYNRMGRNFISNMKPIHAITYTPDFTFEYNDMLIIIEVKGFENDVFPVKKSLFRKYLETLEQPSMFFEIRTKRELLDALKIIRMESPQIQKIRKLLLYLPEKDIPIGNKILEKRDFEELNCLVSSAIIKVEKARDSGSDRYDGIDLDGLYDLQCAVVENI